MDANQGGQEVVPGFPRPDPITPLVSRSWAECFDWHVDLAIAHRLPEPVSDDTHQDDHAQSSEREYLESRSRDSVVVLHAVVEAEDVLVDGAGEHGSPRTEQDPRSAEDT